MGGKRIQINRNGEEYLERHILTTFLSRTGKLYKRKTPLAVLVALGGVGDADARGGGELDARAGARIFRDAPVVVPLPVLEPRSLA